MLKPLRIEDRYQRRAWHMPCSADGLQRLAHQGARRFKVGFESAAARNLYTGAGFKVTASICDATNRSS